MICAKFRTLALSFQSEVRNETFLRSFTEIAFEIVDKNFFDLI